MCQAWMLFKIVEQKLLIKGQTQPKSQPVLWTPLHQWNNWQSQKVFIGRDFKPQ